MKNEEIIKYLKKELKDGVILGQGKGTCKCEYDKKGVRFGLCLRCAGDRLQAHRKGQLQMAKKILNLLQE